MRQKSRRTAAGACSGRRRGSGTPARAAMKRESQPRCLRSNQPNISVGRSTHGARPLATTSLFLRASWSRCSQSSATEFTTDELIWTIYGRGRLVQRGEHVLRSQSTLLRTNSSAVLPVICACSITTTSAPAKVVRPGAGFGEVGTIRLRTSGCSRARIARLLPCLSIATSLRVLRLCELDDQVLADQAGGAGEDDRSLASFIVALKLAALEQRSRQKPDDEHDRAPEPRQVDSPACRGRSPTMSRATRSGWRPQRALRDAPSSACRRSRA